MNDKTEIRIYALHDLTGVSYRTPTYESLAKDGWRATKHVYGPGPIASRREEFPAHLRGTYEKDETYREVPVLDSNALHLVFERDIVGATPELIARVADRDELARKLRAAEQTIRDLTAKLAAATEERDAAIEATPDPEEATPTDPSGDGEVLF